MPGALTPFTREATRETGEVVREFDLRSAAVVLSAFIGGLFLVFFLAAFVPWLLANGMTAAVEGLMHQIGFADTWHAENLGDWVLILLVGLAFTLFIVALVLGVLTLYNLISKRTGMTMNVLQDELARPDDRLAIAEPVEPDADDRTFDELYSEAQRRRIPGRSAMSKAELEAALKPKRRRAATTRRR